MCKKLLIILIVIAALVGLLATPVALLAAPKIEFFVEGSSIQEGVVGSQLTISGSGYSAYNDIDISYDGVKIAKSSTGANGKFTHNLVIPPSYNGEHTIVATDISAGTATAIFTILQWLELSTYDGYVGDTVLVNGTGFNASKPMTVTYNSAAITTLPILVATDDLGNFNASFLIPPLEGPAGSKLVEASDGANSTVVNIIVAADTVISPETNGDSPGYVGMELSINGFGYKPQASVTITFDIVELVVATTSADGTFTANIVIPPKPTGSHTIAISDGTTSRQFVFWMEGAAPQVPSLIAPINDATVEEPVGFNWQEVNDPSGVSYTLQVATDNGFSNLLVNKEGLSGLSYSVNGAELSSKDGSLYWRIMATDSAGNESDWSTTASFDLSSGSTTSWIIYLLYGLGGLVVLGLGLWLVRRRGTGRGSSFAF